MPYVLTADQLGSRRGADLVAAAVDALKHVPTRLPFTRTVGDELQGLLSDPLSVVDAMVVLMRNERWHIGVGIGPVEEPLPTTAPAARGPAFVCARTAVERAKGDPSHVAVVAVADPEQHAADAEAALRLLAAIYRHRTEAGWQAVDQARSGHTQLEAAKSLSVTRQAVGQRLQAAEWAAESDALPMLTRLLGRAEAVATP